MADVEDDADVAPQGDVRLGDRDPGERREARRRDALEINDNVVQHLAVATYLLKDPGAAEARDLVDRSLAEAKRIIADLLDESAPGELRRRAAASD